MKKYELSVVNIVPESDVEAVNQFAFDLGCGENNLSVKLVDVSGNIFYGCHSFWNVDDYAFFKSLETDALHTLYERVVLYGEAQENIDAALTELSLSVFEEQI